ncbi:hypothetical protein LCGC14_2992410, partial [marine sediment metagenome]
KVLKRQKESYHKKKEIKKDGKNRVEY